MSTNQTALSTTTITGYENTSAHWDRTSSFAAVMTFEDLPVPGNNDFLNLSQEMPYYGVVFSFAGVAGDHLIATANHSSDYWSSDGTGPFLTPHSGRVALFNPIGLPLDFATERILTGLWVARPNLGPAGVGGADHLTVTAYSGDLPLASLSIDLAGTVPIFWDTSSFLHLPSVTRYTIAPAQPGLETGYFVADDFQFAPFSLDDMCPCDGQWKSHRGYVACIGATTSVFTEIGALTRSQAKDLLKEAQKSDCGR